MSQTDSVSLLQVISTTLVIVSAVVGAATAYLRLFVSNQTGALKEAIKAEIDIAFVRKGEIDDLRRRVAKVEEKLEAHA